MSGCEGLSRDMWGEKWDPAQFDSEAENFGRAFLRGALEAEGKNCLKKRTLTPKQAVSGLHGKAFFISRDCNAVHSDTGFSYRRREKS